MAPNIYLLEHLFSGRWVLECNPQDQGNAQRRVPRSMKDLRSLCKCSWRSATELSKHSEHDKTSQIYTHPDRQTNRTSFYEFSNSSELTYTFRIGMIGLIEDLLFMVKFKFSCQNIAWERLMSSKSWKHTPWVHSCRYARYMYSSSKMQIAGRSASLH